jgi:hypothetical protein
MSDKAMVCILSSFKWRLRSLALFYTINIIHLTISVLLFKRRMNISCIRYNNVIHLIIC